MFDPNHMLMPVFALVTLPFIIALRLAYLRNAAVASKKVPLDDFKLLRDTTKHDDTMLAVSRNYINLFEMPVLFYLVVVLYYVTYKADMTALTLAWGYVACRYIHTLVHIGKNEVPLRFAAFGGSVAFLLGLWVKLGLAIYLR